MKTAFLVMAYNRPAALARLLDRLSHPDSLFFIHIDRRADIAPFRSLLGDWGNVRFVPETSRVSMHYTGFSMAHAALNLLVDAVAASDAERFVLLSGADYPVQPVA